MSEKNLFNAMNHSQADLDAERIEQGEQRKKGAVARQLLMSMEALSRKEPDSVKKDMMGTNHLRANVETSGDRPGVHASVVEGNTTHDLSVSFDSSWGKDGFVADFVGSLQSTQGGRTRRNDHIPMYHITADTAEKEGGKVEILPDTARYYMAIPNQDGTVSRTELDPTKPKQLRELNELVGGVGRVPGASIM